MKILAIDPSSKCGWAIDGLDSGVWDLTPQRHESCGMRFVRLRKYLKECHEVFNFEMIAYEEVSRHIGTYSAHIYGGIIAIIQEFCEKKEIDYIGIPVSTIKKHATRKGNANKENMMKAARRLYPDAEIIDDNHADALLLLSYAKKHYGTN